MSDTNTEAGFQSKSGNSDPVSAGTMNGIAEAASGLVGDDAIRHAQSALGNAKDAVGSGMQAASSEIDALKEQIGKLAQTVAQLVQSQASTAREQVKSAVGTASESLSQSAAAAQSTFNSVEADVESRIKRNPWTAIAIAGLIGLILAKATS